MSFYSNNNTLQIDISEELLDSKITFYDLLGRQINEFKLISTSSSHAIDSGIHLIKIEKEGATFSKKVMIN